MEAIKLPGSVRYATAAAILIVVTAAWAAALSISIAGVDGEGGQDVDLMLPYLMLPSVNMSASLSVASPGDVLNYTIRCHNPGPKELSCVVVTLRHPIQAIAISARPPLDGGTGYRWSLGIIPTGSTAEIVVAVAIGEMGTEPDEGYLLNSTAILSSAEGGPATASGSVSVMVVPQERLNGNASSINEASRSRSSVYGSEGDASTSIIDANGVVGVSSKGQAGLETSSNASIMYSSRSNAVSGTSGIYGSGDLLTASGSGISSSTWIKNGATGSVMSEDYLYARSIDSDRSIIMDNNGTTVSGDTQFNGMAHADYLKLSDHNDSRGHISSTFESSEDYLGTFNVNFSADEYGRNVQESRSVVGEGQVSADTRIDESHRSHQSGTGSYSSDEEFVTHTGFISKYLDVSQGAMSYMLAPGRWINSSLEWNEGILSKTNNSLISEEVMYADRIKRSTVARGTKELATELSFSGLASLNTVKGDILDIDEAYAGNYTVTRDVQLMGNAAYSSPHIWIQKEGSILGDGTSAGYRITIINDGGMTLAPVYVRDIFPPGTAFLSASVRPSTLDGSHAEWTLTHLSVGDVSVIHIVLEIPEDSAEAGSGLVNRVEAEGACQGGTVTAANFSAIAGDWLGCCPVQVTLSKEVWTDPSDPLIVWYRLRMQNIHGTPVAAKIMDSLPEGMIYINSSIPLEGGETVAYGSILRWTQSDLEPGEIFSIEYRVRAVKEGSYTNSAHADAYTVDGTEGQADATATVRAGS